jgi:molybdopterin molybdotransferase
MPVLREASWSAARSAAASCVDRLESEQIPVAATDRRVLAEDLHALCDLPSFDTSAMDGWAVAGVGPWRIVGDLPAGAAPPPPLSDGTAVRIATGAVVPDGCTGVLRWEEARVREDVVDGACDAGADIRRAGEECAAGDLIAVAGTDVAPALAGFLAATGHDLVPVRRRPRARLLLLGDELLQRGIPSAGRVRDSLGPQLPGWLVRAGAEVGSHAHVADDLDSVVAAFADAAAQADLVITTGGTAEGPRDHVHGAVEKLAGELIVDKVDVRPGHPMLLATLPTDRGHSVPLVGLPGNPHSAVVGFVTLVVPLVDAMLGRARRALPRVRTAEDLRTPSGRTRLIAGTLDDGRFRLSPYGGSAMLRGLAQSRGFAVVDGDVPVDGSVEWLALP